MSRAAKITLAILLFAVALGMLYLRGMHERFLRLVRPERSEQQAVRELTQPVTSAAVPKVKAQLYWLSAELPENLEAVELELPLEEAPVARAKQLIQALISQAPSPDRRLLPADAALLEFYLLPDGTAVADFSAALATQLPSGILSETLAVESIARTLAANLSGVERLKILVQGQEPETLAGHLDLSGFFPVRGMQPANPLVPAAAGNAGPALTPQRAPGKLSP